MCIRYIRITAQFWKRSFCPGMLSAQSKKEMYHAWGLVRTFSVLQKRWHCPCPADKAETSGKVLAQRNELSGELHLLLNNIMTNASMCSVLQSSPPDITLKKKLIVMQDRRVPEWRTHSHSVIRRPQHLDVSVPSSTEKLALQLLSANREASASTITVLFQAYHSTELMIILWSSFVNLSLTWASGCEKVTLLWFFISDLHRPEWMRSFFFSIILSAATN